MRINFFLIIVFISCSNKEIDTTFKVISNKKHNTQLQPKENSKGFLVLKNTYNQNDVLTIYSFDKSKWKSFNFNDNFNDKDIVPYAIKPENTLLVFKCLRKENGFYEIVINDEKNVFKYIKESDSNFKYQTIEQHILTVFSVDFNENINPLRLESNDTSKHFPKNRDSFYYPIKIINNWLMVEDDNKDNFWIKWCDEKGNLILDLYYDA